MVADVPLYAAIVDPHCAHELSGIPPDMPACVQSAARVGLMIPLQVWALEASGRSSRSGMSEKRNERLHLM
jgi:hypothetical protein